ncbi:MAG: hypothetical protein QOE19_3570 [Actinomycetota bacterium]|nr:hypothetical protein [Actinomycetota bacterium]MDQ1670770.1 hypothetical protein [Actinomycetota bacterium]
MSRRSGARHRKPRRPSPKAAATGAAGVVAIAATLTTLAVYPRVPDRGSSTRPAEPGHKASDPLAVYVDAGTPTAAPGDGAPADAAEGTPARAGTEPDDVSPTHAKTGKHRTTSHSKEPVALSRGGSSIGTSAAGSTPGDSAPTTRGDNPNRGDSVPAAPAAPVPVPAAPLPRPALPLPSVPVPIPTVSLPLPTLPPPTLP